MVMAWLGAAKRLTKHGFDVAFHTCCVSSGMVAYVVGRASD